MSHISVRGLQYLVAAAEAGSMSAAARSLYVTQPAISAGVADLERQLGVQLFFRDKGNGISLTVAGVEILRRARIVLGEIEGLSSSANVLGGEVSGVLSIGCYATLTPFIIPRVVEEFSAMHPRCEVHFIDSSTDKLNRGILSGEIELALLYDLDRDPRIRYDSIYETRPRVLLPQSHPLATRSSVRLSALAQENLILYEPGAAYFLRLLANLGISPVVRHRTDSFEAVRCLVGRALGYSLLNQHPFHNGTYDGRQVVVIEIAEAVPPLAVVVGSAAGAQMTRRAQVFANFCKDSFAATPPTFATAPPTTPSLARSAPGPRRSPNLR